jgi:hypothetical protein
MRIFFICLEGSSAFESGSLNFLRRSHFFDRRSAIARRAVLPPPRLGEAALRCVLRIARPDAPRRAAPAPAEMARIPQTDAYDPSKSG